MTSENQIPRATAQRLPIYYYYLSTLNDAGIKRINSSEISEAIKFDAATVRRDFSYFGALGKRGFGYDVSALLSFFSKVLSQDKLNKVAVVGVGNLGQALMKNNFSHTSNIEIVMGFDADDDKRSIKLVNEMGKSVPVYHVKELAERLHANNITIAILTVPEKAAQEVTDQLVAAGIKGILNFSPIRITVPSSVRVQNVDLTTGMQTLIYFVDNFKNIKSAK
ncbi:redox-sensing transcriptional repressor Rex [Oenococcus kitaharae]|uniref:Redox-sensing transcriptional repressor Rex n=1 Tax=Oenococcus kitaharae DSM 17330 TaxID=1045004 RepID=G9WGP0_9LACO|nr:redox-sensing transcriptional repressor Rex [Oenococcus kitaharae]EHN59867.1 Redox-sensitive transcriptional regulator (AT-rich DNA-binding protein) [Oenococcus kitaharae DSM 17330]MCV3296687.1 redox-sensing transcriptional repressor Rex [Oenococcus kitaharae]OEY82059.1 redox-sensing transcriptional repressor Rex [Oenococcus kitaharae]OEY82486.1 redox-sensing transcriptional repressor Rex [Oenococcus kitaharae]OEY83772.1 redox-sensing transcriptional repressor Rex [Oenococcus kitaharae]